MVLFTELTVVLKRRKPCAVKEKVMQCVCDTCMTSVVIPYKRICVAWTGLHLYFYHSVTYLYRILQRYRIPTALCTKNRHGTIR